MDLSVTNFDRRGFLRTGAAVGGGALALGLLGGCSDEGTSPDPAPGTAKPKRGGSLKLALYGASSSDTTDGQNALSAWEFAINFQLYNSLLSKTPINGDSTNGFEAGPGIAESVEYDGAQKLIVKLRDGVEFHNGKTLTADDVLFSFGRITDPGSPAVGAQFLQSMDLKNSRAIGDRTVEVALSRPDYFFRGALSNIACRMYPADWDPKNPVGTGPWKLKDFRPGKFASFERFENYFDTPAYADELVFQAYDDPTALVNALTSGAVNLLANVPVSQVKLLESNSAFKILSSPSAFAAPAFAMRMKTAPFTNPRVREAFRLMIDRQAIIDQLYGGRGTLGNDVPNRFDAAYNSDLPQREHDPDKAKALLAEAGVAPLELALATGGFVPNAEVVFAQAAKDAGVSLQVKKVDQSTFYSQNYAQDPIFSTVWTSTATMDQIIAENSLADSPYNETQETRPEIAQLFEQAQGTEDEQQRTDLIKQIQQFQWEDGGYIFPAFPDQIDASSQAVQGALADTSGQSFAQFNMKAMWLT